MLVERDLLLGETLLLMLHLRPVRWTELGKQEAGLRHLSQSLPCALQQEFSGPQFTTRIN